MSPDKSVSGGSRRPSVQARSVAYLALIDEISDMAIGELPSEQVFSETLERVVEIFQLDVVAVYAGEPLTLRMQSGGVPARPGLTVPDGLARVAAQERKVMVSTGLRRDSGWFPPPWASKRAQSEAAIPLVYRGRRIGVLDLCSTQAGGFDEVDLGALGTVARLLAVVIAQESWGRHDAPSHELKRAYQRLQEFSELKGQILRNVSHELRTPLTLVKGYLELLMDDQMGVLPPEQRQTLDMLCDRVDDIVTIVDRTVSLSPLNNLSVAYEKIIVADMLREIVGVFERRMRGPTVTIDLQSIDGDLYLYGDVEKIRQLCHNLLDNSVKFSPNGGRVLIDAASEGSGVHFVFADEGIGMPERQLSQIFETFYQIDGSSTRRFGGLGLGLTVVDRIVEAHKGEIWVDSAEGQGSTFHVVLPKHVPRAEGQASS